MAAGLRRVWVDPLPWLREQPATARWGGAQASRRPAQGADRQPHGTRCLEEHHPSGPQRIHLLGRRCQAGEDAGTSDSPDPGGARGWHASTLLLARVRAPRAHREVVQYLHLAVGGVARQGCSGCCPTAVLRPASRSCWCGSGGALRGFCSGWISEPWSSYRRHCRAGRGPRRRCNTRSRAWSRRTRPRSR
jgi:hypothetical protein